MMESCLNDRVARAKTIQVEDLRRDLCCDLSEIAEAQVSAQLVSPVLTWSCLLWDVHTGQVEAHCHVFVCRTPAVWTESFYRCTSGYDRSRRRSLKMENLRWVVIIHAISLFSPHKCEESWISVCVRCVAGSWKYTHTHTQYSLLRV